MSETSTGSFRKLNNFGIVKDNVMDIAWHFVFVNNNKSVKFHVKIPSGCLENSKKNVRGYFFCRTLYAIMHYAYA